MKTRERISSDIDEFDWWNKLVKNWEINKLNCRQNEFSNIFYKIDSSNLNIIENKKVNYICYLWIVSMKLLFISSVTEPKIKS
jgi:hypothetical protein